MGFLTILSSIICLVAGALAGFFLLARNSKKAMERAARTIARMFLSKAQGLELWGLGVRRPVLEDLREGTAPPPQQPGYAPTGASGVHLVTELDQPLAAGGTPLGHEPLIADVGCSFNSPAALHLDEAAVWRGLGVQPNEHGLIDSYDEALAGCREFAGAKVAGPAPQSGWFPGLIVRYSLESRS